MKVLVVGSTGMVGGEVARRLASKGEHVRGLIRSTSDRAKVAALKAAGVETVEGDLREPSSLSAACRGVDAVITTASAMPNSWQESNTIGEIDREGTINLIDAASNSGVKRFVHTSFPHEPEPGYPLGDAKAAAEKHLTKSGLEYTILAANYFMEVWLSPALGFDYNSASATIYGAGTNPLSWVSFVDVARTACEALSRSEAKNATLPVGGPEALTPLEVVRLFEKTTGKKWSVQHVSEEALRAQLDAATDEVQHCVTMLQLTYATSKDFGMDPSKYLIRDGLKSVQQYAAEVSKQTAGV